MSRRKIWVYLGVGVGGLVAAGMLVLSIYVYIVTRDLPSVDALKNYNPPVTTRVYAGNGTVIGEFARQRRIFVPIAFVPKLVIDAFISAEDKNYYSHPGIDVEGILRAGVKDVYNVLVGRRLEGASTITQQVARNFLLNSQVKFSRKIREAVLALRLDATYSKDKVLELYLNEIFLGQNSYGVAAAALNYFGKSLDQLSVGEVAFLASLPRSPSNYNPRYHLKAATDRRNWVIGQMAENGYITQAQAAAAIAQPLVTQTRPLGSQAEDADYFVEEVRRLLYDKYGEHGLYDAGLQVRATLDTRLQNFAVNALRTGLVRYDRRHGWRGAVSHIDIHGDWKDVLKSTGNQSGIESWRVAAVLGYGADDSVTIGLDDGSEARIPFSELKWARPELKNAYVGPEPTSPEQVVKPGDVVYVEPVDNKGDYGLRQVPEVNGAIVVMDPHTGRVLAMSGGFSFASSQFDRAMQAMRQPGSSFKPFVYAAALDNGYTPASEILDAPVALPQGPGLPLWTPKNYEKTFLGLTTLRRGLELSRNLMTIRLAYDIGMDKVVPYALRFGIYDKMTPYLSNAIGAQETTLMRMTTGYSEFVNGGKKISATLIDRVQNRNGITVYRHDKRLCTDCNGPWTGQLEPLLPDTREQILDPRTAYQIVSMLQGVVERGTGIAVSAVGKPLAGKTGTSNDAKDTWFVGFSPDLVCGVFVGFDNPRTLGHNEQGATVAAPIFRDFMKAALAGVPPTPFRVPPGIDFATVNRFSGAPEPAGAPNTILEAFKAGTEPALANVNPNQPQQNKKPASNVGQGTGGLY
ncbi:MAG: penicillin-binding protein 1A [Alphaproteobacteria bacterium]|nr:penicillin-binding protein 1A [Alphaproteobacteria bacterium]MBU6471139.1 penicillin-binding protein 1A [Alphaproteobacteria bacterium]MDE2011335.1 penicillin-binding protein 1A [Alphaproteobacteria bacterium]